MQIFRPTGDENMPIAKAGRGVKVARRAALTPVEGSGRPPQPRSVCVGNGWRTQRTTRWRLHHDGYVDHPLRLGGNNYVHDCVAGKGNCGWHAAEHDRRLTSCQAVPDQARASTPGWPSRRRDGVKNGGQFERPLVKRLGRQIARSTPAHNEDLAILEQNRRVARPGLEHGADE